MLVVARDDDDDDDDPKLTGDPFLSLSFFSLPLLLCAGGNGRGGWVRYLNSIQRNDGRPFRESRAPRRFKKASMRSIHAQRNITNIFLNLAPERRDDVSRFHTRL